MQMEGWSCSVYLSTEHGARFYFGASWRFLTPRSRGAARGQLCSPAIALPITYTAVSLAALLSFPSLSAIPISLPRPGLLETLNEGH